MARQHGRFGRLYADTGATAGAAVPTVVPFIADWTVDEDQDQVEVTAMGDTTKTYVLGLGNFNATANGFLDVGDAAIYNLTDGNARKFYFYPDINTGSNPTNPMAHASAGNGYWYSDEGRFSRSSSGGATSALGISLTWVSSSSVFRI